VSGHSPPQEVDVPGRTIRNTLGIAALGTLIALGGFASASAAEADLHSGLAHLRAGAQAQAERDFAKYRDGLRDVEARRSIDRVLPLLRRPLSEDVREYLAVTIEEDARLKAEARPRPGRPGFLSRMFPVFP
jgi:hypothetical protein